jgi:hypothetical protein
LKQQYGADFVALASIGQKTPDLILQYDNVQTQVEVKGRDRLSSPLAFFEKSARRDQCDSEALQRLAQIYSNGQVDCFQQLIQQYRDINNSIGFPGDEGVINSGKLPPELTVKDDNPILTALREYAIACLHAHNNNYFAIYNKTAHNIQLFYTGLGENVFDAPTFPQFNSAALTTYGSSYKGAMRVALKIKLCDDGQTIGIPAIPLQ